MGRLMPGARSKNTVSFLDSADESICAIVRLRFSPCQVAVARMLFCYSRCFLIAPHGKIILADTALKSWTPIGSDLGAAINLKTEG